MKFLRLIPFLFVLFTLVAMAQVTVPVTGNLNNELGNAQPDAFVRIRLRNFSGNVPRVTSSGVAVVTQEDIHPNASGVISTQVYGNDVINPANTYYTLEFWQSGKAQSSQNFLITVAGGAFNFNTAIPISTTPGPPPFLPVLQNPTANQTVSGNLSLTFDGPLFFDNEVNFGPVFFANLSNVLKTNGDQAYCQDCQQQTPCVGGGTGAMAQQIAGVAQCSTGSGGGGGTPFALVTNPPSNVTNFIVPPSPTVTPLTLQCGIGSAPTLIAQSILNSAGGNAWNVTCGGNMTVGDGVTGTLSGAAVFGALNTVTFSATPQFNLASADVFQMTLTGNVTSSSLLNMPSSVYSEVFTLILCQDGVGSRTFVPPSNFVNFATISSTPNVCTVQAFATNGTSAYGLSGGTGGGSGLTGTLTATVFPKATGVNTVANSTLSEVGNPPIIGAPRIEGIRYIDQFNWTPQTPTGSLTGGSPATVTLVPCPFGISGTDSVSRIHIDTVGTPEDPVLTGTGSCAPGGASGTITFTPAFSHANGYTVRSSSAGFQEALNDAGLNLPNSAVKLAPTPGTSGAYKVTGTVTPQSNNSFIDASGAVLDCETTDRCVNITATAQVRMIAMPRFATNLQLLASAITATACASNTATITATNSFSVGQVVDIQNTFQQQYWGPHTVVSATGSQFTYTGCTTASSAASGGGASLQQAAIEDNNNGVVFFNVNFNQPGGFSGWFNNGLVIDNDQAARIQNIEANSGFHCDANYCSNVIYAPGPFSTNAAVLYVDKANMSLNCIANGIRNYAGNTLSVQDSVIQGYPEFGIMSGTLRGGFGPTNMSNVYMEVGSCSNPIYTSIVGSSTAAQTGVLMQGQTLHLTAGEGPQGVSPVFTGAGTGGSTRNNYWIVPHDSVLGYGRPILAGISTPTGAGTIHIYWPRIQGSNTLQYDLLMTQGSGVSLVVPNGTGNYLVNAGLNVAQCSALLCTANDNQSSLTSYTVQATAYDPVLWYWPAPIVLSTNADNNDPSVLYTDRWNFGVVAEASEATNGSGVNFTSIYAKQCSPGNLYSPTLASCDQWDPSTGNGGNDTGAHLYRMGVEGGTTTQLKGLLNFINPVNSSIGATHIITLRDSMPEKTLATFGNRPTADANDTWIGFDQATNVAAANSQLAFGAPISISQYIGNAGDNTSWKTRLTSSVFQGQVPFSAPTATNLYVVDGITYTSTCSLVTSTIPINSAAIIYSMILETNMSCDPFNQNRDIELHLGRFTAEYTTNVPWRIGTNEILAGVGRGFSGGGNTKGTTIGPGSSYASPYVSTNPSGFTISATSTSCPGVPSAGAYFIEVTWGPDSTRETVPANETSVTVGAGQCFSIVPPVSPPANVTTYDVYACSTPGCASGSELWIAQKAIGTSATVGWSGSSFPSGSGRPPMQGTTGDFIVVGNANGAQGNAGSTQANFGAVLRDLSIDCQGSTGMIAAGLLTGEEGSGIFSVDAQNCPGLDFFQWEGYGNLGEAASNSRITNITMNAGSSFNPSVAGIYIDQVTSVRGLDGFTCTVVLSACILENGTLFSPVGGLPIVNGHLEKATDGIKTVNGHVYINNVTCSPANMTNCVHLDANSFGSTVELVRAGGTTVALQDDAASFTSTQGIIGNYFQSPILGVPQQIVGPAPTCTVTGMGTAGGECVLTTGSNNFAGKMQLTADCTGGCTATITVTLTAAGTGNGINGQACQYEALNGTTPWPNNTTHKKTLSGTGADVVLWIPGGGTGTAFSATNAVAIHYSCPPY